MALSKEKPTMDPELRQALEAVAFPMIAKLTPEILTMMRTATKTPATYIDKQRNRGISHREVRIPSHDDKNHEVVLSILQLAASEGIKGRPCLYWMHGGALHWGDRLHTLEYATDAILETDAICVSVEYRLAPEHPFSTAVEDCYTGLKWTSENLQHLGADPTRLMIGGMSAGGLLAASIAILSRDRKGPALCAQLLICPAIDDRSGTESCRQFVEASDFLPTQVAKDMWKASLRDSRNDSLCDIVIPGRADDLSRLPMAYLDVGSAEVLRDETVAYASRLWANGVQAELHVWNGGFHGFDMFLPHVPVSQAARKAKIAWIKRVFGVKG